MSGVRFWGLLRAVLVGDIVANAGSADTENHVLTLMAAKHLDRQRWSVLPRRVRIQPRLLQNFLLWQYRGGFQKVSL